jgi:outer membrane protein TolC
MILNFKRLMSTIGRIAVIACLFMPALHAQYLSLEEAVAIGLRENLGLVTADSRIAAAGVNTGRGAAGMLPSVTAQGGGSFTLDNATQTFLDGRENSIVGGADLRFNGSVRMDWTIYDGKAMYLRRDQLQDTYELATLTKQREAQELAASISRAYQELVLQTRLVAIIDEDVSYLEDLLKLTEAKLSIGSATRLDVLQAKTDLNELVNSRELALLQYAITAGTLNRDLNREASIPLSVDTSFLKFNEVFPYQQWTEMALQANPDIRLSAKELAIAERDIALAEAERQPQVNLNSGLNFSYLSSNSGFLLRNQSYGPFIGLTASYNIFDGHRVSRNVELAKLGVTIAKLGYDQASLTTKNELFLLYQQYEYYVAQARVEKENLGLSAENFALADELYRNGRINQFELRQVRLQRLDIERRLAQAEYQQILAYIGLMELSGQSLL